MLRLLKVLRFLIMLLIPSPPPPKSTLCCYGRNFCGEAVRKIVILFRRITNNVPDTKNFSAPNPSDTITRPQSPDYAVMYDSAIGEIHLDLNVKYKSNVFQTTCTLVWRLAAQRVQQDYNFYRGRNGYCRLLIGMYRRQSLSFKSTSSGLGLRLSFGCSVCILQRGLTEQ